MQLDTLIQFIIATALVTVIPGPNIILIVNDSIRHGTQKGLRTALGVSAGMIPLFILSLAGISSLLISQTALFDGIRLMGMLYLVYLGVMMMISGFRRQENSGIDETGRKTFFIHGMFTCMTNPKGLLFAGAFFPQFIEKSAPLIPQVMILIFGCLLVATAIGALYAAFAGKAGYLLRSDRFTRYTSLVSGILMILFGLSFLISGSRSVV